MFELCAQLNYGLLVLDRGEGLVLKLLAEGRPVLGGWVLLVHVTAISLRLRHHETAVDCDATEAGAVSKQRIHFSRGVGSHVRQDAHLKVVTLYGLVGDALRNLDSILVRVLAQLREVRACVIVRQFLD